MEPTTVTHDIMDTTMSTGRFDTLAAAIDAAGLTDTMKGTGPFTILAPTDDAFAKMDPDTLSALLKPENRNRLTDILTYHCIPGRITASDISRIPSARTVGGRSVSISCSGGCVTVNGARVVRADIECTNGVIHAIDNVLMPPSR